MPWRDPQNYAYTSTHTLKDWGWEFIRRDPRYQDEWKAALKGFHTTPRKDVLMPFLIAPDVSAYPPPDGTLNLIDPDDVDAFAIPSPNAAKWGLACYQNPLAKVMRKACFLPVKTLHIDPVYADEHMTVSVDVEPHTLVGVIDLKKPIIPQLDILKASAVEKQNAIREKDPGLVLQSGETVTPLNKMNWTNYLRCLDAKNGGVKRKEASNIVFPSAPDPGKRYSDTHEQIKEMAENYYRRIMG